MFLHWVVFRQILPPLTTPSPAPTESPTLFPTLSTPSPTSAPTTATPAPTPESTDSSDSDSGDSCDTDEFLGDIRCNLWYDPRRCCGYIDETKRIFVTSTEFSADLMKTSDFAGVTGADAICQSHASGAGYNGLFKAWIATDRNDTPRVRFSRHKGNYVNAADEMLFKCWDDMIRGNKPENTLWMDEKGNVLEETTQGAATNLDEFGNFYENGELQIGSCKNWNYDETRGSDLTPSEAGIGVSENGYGLRPDKYILCNQMIRFICVEQ
jgi:hypothetical protein